jgi:hypothetical protein
MHSALQYKHSYTDRNIDTVNRVYLMHTCIYICNLCMHVCISLNVCMYVCINACYVRTYVCIYIYIWTTGRSGFDPRQGQRIFPLASVSRPALGPTQPPVPGVKRGRGVMLTTHPHLVPRVRMSRSYTYAPPSAFVACSGTALPFYQSLKIGAFEKKHKFVL